jgi:hypothetical protein
VISSNSGRYPGSSQPPGDTIRAMLTDACPVLTRPAYSSMRFGRLPARFDNGWTGDQYWHDGIPRCVSETAVSATRAGASTSGSYEVSVRFTPEIQA